ncbi:hypothetical protein PHSY_004337 [Pseudozyma hubeiensis SY62]|uniref:Uncharacterized protein n=1 Tax=Pseudozyma hubeiensis (strain SY62) TaxID=1305764 RepID=R9P5R6_PSEHS|nr:hypothetical protein PHSY_004337 [Pseudozyma hubeiensis SY62]GAC96753.1 hypothetical protein PHSY_004337 [Pseudozyma hubeiensis SY62]
MMRGEEGDDDVIVRRRSDGVDRGLRGRALRRGRSGWSGRWRMRLSVRSRVYRWAGHAAVMAWLLASMPLCVFRAVIRERIVLRVGGGAVKTRRQSGRAKGLAIDAQTWRGSVDQDPGGVRCGPKARLRR